MANDRLGVNSFDPPSGMVRKGSIVGYDANTNTLQVELTESPAARGRPFSIPVPHSFTLVQSDGIFMGALPAKNTTITLAQSSGGEYHLVGFEPEQTHLHLVPDLRLGELLLHTTDTSKIMMDTDSNIKIGSDAHYIHTFSGSQQYPESNLISINFQNANHFTQAYREVGGVIKRDQNPNPQAASYTGDTKLEDDSYDNIFSVIGMDPTSTSNDLITGPTKNPPLVEHREIVYEFKYESQVDDDAAEANKYKRGGQSNPTLFTTPNRRNSRADTMSLSLVAPNFLIEEVKGTVVDIFGNILDLNRIPIPIGLSADNTLRTNGTVATTDSKQSYLNIRALERKSIAFHFEINARKDPNPKNQGSDLTINDDNYNAKLQRSRFFFDIDKEGQFKLNVPASSETGNIPLLVRPENYSSFATTDNGNKNQTWPVKGGQPVGQDIFVDSFAAPQSTPSSASTGFDTTFEHGSIQLIDSSNKADAGPPDRISQYVKNAKLNIRHGTVYHDILNTCTLHQKPESIQNYQYGTVPNPVDTTYITALTDIVSKTIKVAGPEANAGGRSGSINLDGSLEMNIGANTVDRQSLWLDTAGGLVANIGRDRNKRSAMVNFDGDVFIQIGGMGIVASDARFTGKDGSSIGVLDLRVFVAGNAHMFRIDEKGVTVTTPQVFNIYAASGINMKSDGPIYIDSDQLHLNQRLVYPPDSPGVSTSI